MRERELERVMRDFVAQRYNVLLCSTIIETGIDVPTANTIVIQPRRQVRPGAAAPAARPRRPLAPPGLRLPADAAEDARLTKQAQKRLEAIQMMEELGSGFYLAMHDLEIRGAGEVLGETPERQHAWRSASSSTTTCWPKPVRALKAGREPDLLSPLVGHDRDQPARARRCCPTTTAATCTRA